MIQIAARVTGPESQRTSFAEMNNMCPDEALERAASRENGARLFFQRLHLKEGREEVIRWFFFFPSERENSSYFHLSRAMNNLDRTPVFLRPSTI